MTESGRTERGKGVVAITGATSGIGRAAAQEAARQGMRVILLVRDSARGEAVCDHITAATGDPVRATVVQCDLSSFAGVRSAAAAVRELCPALDVLVNNAGVIAPKRTLTVDGHELTFQVNHLSHFLLTHELMPALAAARGRVINVSSDAHFAAWRGIRLDDPGFEKGWSPFRAYAHSKLANIVFTCELAGRVADHGVSAYVMHPGVVKSGFGADGWGAAGTLWNLFVPKLTPQQGADTLVHLITAEQIEEPSGTYFFRRQAKRSSPVSHDLEAQRGLWELSERLTAIVEVPGVSGEPGK